MTFDISHLDGAARATLAEKIADAIVHNERRRLASHPDGAVNQHRCWFHGCRRELPPVRAEWVCEDAHAYCSQACLARHHARVHSKTPDPLGCPESYWGER